MEYSAAVSFHNLNIIIDFFKYTKNLWYDGENTKGRDLKMSIWQTFGLSYIISVLIVWIPLTIWEYKKFPKCSETLTVNINGHNVKCQRVYCPVCGNTDLEYVTLPVGAKTMNFSGFFSKSTSINYDKFAKCPKCGNAFSTSKKPRPIVNLFYGIVLGVPLMFVVYFVLIFVFF